MRIDYLKKIRETVGHELVLFPSTACLILQEDELLLQLRADNNLWGLPGGIMDVGETVCESLAREVMEETGLTIINPTLFGIYSGSRYEGTYPNGDQAAVVQSVFLVKKFSGELRSSDEGLDVRFFPLDQLPEEISWHHREPVQHLLQFLAGELALPFIM